MTDLDCLMRFPVDRRALLGLLGASAALSLTKPAQAQAVDMAPVCAPTPDQTEGPYFVDEGLNRSDIRSDPTDGLMRPGIVLTLALRVAALEGGRCSPIQGAIVDIWHCDAAGVYSDATDSGFDTRGSKFLRGYQLSDAAGMARFTTIYPGWYPGRAVHIHFKVRAQRASGRRIEFTSQLYFDDAVTDRVYAHEPYSRRGPGRQRNESDGIFRRGGSQLILSPVATDEGYAAKFDVGLRIA